MKIVYLTLTTNPELGGWGRLAFDIIDGIAKLGNQVIILKGMVDGYIGILDLKKANSIFIPAWKIRKHIFDCDIIHAFDGYPYGIIAALSNIGLRKKLIITTVGTYSTLPAKGTWKKLMKKLMMHWAYRKADCLTAISNYTKKQLAGKIGHKNITVINPGVNYNKFHQARQAANKNFILSVGDLKSRKGYHISLAAFALAKKKISDLKYIIVGNQDDKDYYSHLRQITIKSGIDKDVEFLTDIKDEKLIKLYAQAKLFLLTSINLDNAFEGFGLVFLEAAAAGLPLIGTLSNGIADAMKDGYNGILVPQNDIAATAEAIVKIVGNNELKESFSRHSYEWAKNNKQEKSVAAYLDIYQQLVH